MLGFVCRSLVFTHHISLLKMKVKVICSNVHLQETTLVTLRSKGNRWNRPLPFRPLETALIETGRGSDRSVVTRMPLESSEALLPGFNDSALMCKYRETTKDGVGRGAVLIMLIINY